MSLDGALRSILDRFGFIGSYLLARDTPYGLQIARGMVPGERLHIGGYSATQTAGSPSTPVWDPGTTYTWATVNQTLTVRSDSANDANGNTGAWTVRIWWLNAAGVEATTDVVMNGINPVVTAALTARRVNRVEVLTCGGASTNVGAITVYWTDNVTVFNVIRATLGRSHSAFQTVPAGKRDIITDLFVGNFSNIGKTFALKTRDSVGMCWLIRHYICTGEEGSRQHPLPIPFRFPAGTDYEIVGGGGVANNAYCALHGYRQAV
jgi:hypothetical protein